MLKTSPSRKVKEYRMETVETHSVVFKAGYVKFIDELGRKRSRMTYTTETPKGTFMSMHMVLTTDKVTTVENKNRLRDVQIQLGKVCRWVFNRNTEVMDVFL